MISDCIRHQSRFRALLTSATNLHARFVKNDNLGCHSSGAVPDKDTIKVETSIAFILLFSAKNILVVTLQKP